MLETSVSMVQLFHRYMGNQQERLEKEAWIVGFTDGEGCFSVSLFRNSTTKSGWQVFPEFVISQGKKSLPALEIFKDYFKCGKIFVNKRYDNHHEYMYRYCVRSLKDLVTIIIPFFEKHHLYTAKRNDFRLFSEIVLMIHQKKHLTSRGLRTIAQKIERMNRKKASSFLKSSEAIRHTPPSRKKVGG